ncbi:MAG: hypothetical protein ABIS14_04560 [Sphingomonas sp.]
MIVLVSDTSVLIDLERAGLTAQAFGLPYEFAVPDVLYAAEIAAFGGDALCDLGLRVEAMNGDEVAAALAIRRGQARLSVPDALALALAEARNWGLLSGDGPMRAEAASRGVECRGILWLLDEIETAGKCGPERLCEGLRKLATHKRCRLPAREVNVRLARWSPT